MKVSELMEYPKIRTLLEENWDNDGSSGEFDGVDMSNRLAVGFTWDKTQQGGEFWEYLADHNLEECSKEYPEYFEVPQTFAQPKYLADLPSEMQLRITEGLGLDGCSDSTPLGDVLMYLKYWAEQGKYRQDSHWEGLIFWEKVLTGDLEGAKGMGVHPEWFCGASGTQWKRSEQEPSPVFAITEVDATVSLDYGTPTITTDEFKRDVRKQLNLLAAEDLVDGDLTEKFDKLLKEM